MTKSKLLILAVAPALVLCSCAKKCSFADFQKAVEEIKEAPKITEVTIKGSIKFEGEELKVGKTTLKVGSMPSDEEALKAAELFEMIYQVKIGYFALVEDENAKYYAGSSFKVKTENVTYEWDEYGNCTSIEGEEDGEEVDISCKYTYAE